MTGIYSLFVVLIVIVAILMILIVLIQESKGGGLSSQFSSGNSMLGVRQTTNAIEKLTWGLAAAMVVLSVLCAYVAPTATGDSSVIENAATKTQTTNPVNAQPFDAAQQAAPAAEAPAQPAPAPAE